MKHLKTYTVLFAEDVPHYASGEIEAESAAVALEAAKSYDTDSFCAYEPDWENSTCKRIVHIEDEGGNIVAEAIPLDTFHLRNGGEADRRFCDAVPRLLDALRKIAAIPLWGEPLTDQALRAEYVYVGEYDAEADEFNPSGDTESTNLHDAVQIARAALQTVEGDTS